MKKRVTSVYLDQCIINLCKKIGLDFSTLVKVSYVLSKDNCRNEIVLFFYNWTMNLLDHRSSIKSVRVPKNFFGKNECVSECIRKNILDFLAMVSTDTRYGKRNRIKTD
jgi:uncharacterized protein (DUF488 family)